MDLDISVKQFIAEINEKVRAAQYEALKAVNVQLIRLYWELSKSISEKQEIGWGKAIVPTLSKELQKEFPNMGGLSVGNLWLMAQFYTEYQTIPSRYHNKKKMNQDSNELNCRNTINQKRWSQKKTKQFNLSGRGQIAPRQY